MRSHPSVLQRRVRGSGKHTPPPRAGRVAAVALLLLCAACQGPEREPPAADRGVARAITSSAAIALARTARFGATGVLVGPAEGEAGGGRDRLFAGTVDDAGRLIAVGESARPGGRTRALLLRFTLDGELDTSFGGDGAVVGVDDRAGAGFEPGATAEDAFYAVRLDPRGRIITAGKAATGGRAKALLARYLPDGRLDPDFGDQAARGGRRRGYVIGMGDEYLDDQFSGVRPESSYPDERFHAVEVAPDGRIVAAGVTADLNESWLAESEACATWLPAWLCRARFRTTLLTRWTEEGRLDPTFNEVGYNTGTGGRGRWWLGRHDEWRDLRLLPSGRIVAVGFATGRTDRERRALIASWNEDGTPDEGFGELGQHGFVLGPERAHAGGTREELASITVDPQGKLIAAGTSFDAQGAPRALVVRLLPSGAADPSFAEAGSVVEDVGPADPTVRAALDEQGRVLVSAPPRLLRLTASGALDDELAVRFPSTGTAAVKLHDLITGSFGKTYVVGARGAAWMVARYTRSGALDGGDEAKAPGPAEGR